EIVQDEMLDVRTIVSFVLAGDLLTNCKICEKVRLEQNLFRRIRTGPIETDPAGKKPGSQKSLAHRAQSRKENVRYRVFWKSVSQKIAKAADAEEMDSGNNEKPEYPVPMFPGDLRVLKHGLAKRFIMKNQRDLHRAKQQQSHCKQRPCSLFDILHDRICEIGVLSDPKIADQQRQMNEQKGRA